MDVESLPSPEDRATVQLGHVEVPHHRLRFDFGQSLSSLLAEFQQGPPETSKSLPQEGWRRLEDTGQRGEVPRQVLFAAPLTTARPPGWALISAARLRDGWQLSVNEGPLVPFAARAERRQGLRLVWQTPARDLRPDNEHLVSLVNEQENTWINEASDRSLVIGRLVVGSSSGQRSWTARSYSEVLPDLSAKASVELPVTYDEATRHQLRFAGPWRVRANLVSLNLRSPVVELVGRE